MPVHVPGAVTGADRGDPVRATRDPAARGASRGPLERLGWCACSGGFTGSRPSSVSPAPSTASGASRPTRWPATCSAGSCRGGGRPTSSCATARASTSTSARHPEYATAECDSLDPAGRPRQGGRADPRGPAARRRAPPGRRGHRRRHLPVQEQHRLRGQLLRLPRELPGRPLGGVLPHRRRAAAVPRDPPAHRRRREGAADARGAPCSASPSAPSTSGRACRRPPRARARSSTPATSRTPTPSATAACTSSSATRT